MLIRRALQLRIRVLALGFLLAMAGCGGDSSGGRLRVQADAVETDAAQVGEDTGVVMNAPDNASPVASDDVIAIEEGATVVIDVLANDRDPDGDVLRVKMLSGPGKGKLDAKLRYTAPSNYNGYDEFRYQVSDPHGAAATATVRITVYEKSASGAPLVQLPRTSIAAADLAVIINDNDAVSRSVGAYYASQRKIPPQNVIHIKLPNVGAVLDPDDFAPLLAQVERALPAGIQAYALTWTRPFRVGCMSITSAFGLGGYDDQYCNTSKDKCSTTASVATYDADTTRPYDDLGVRPTMMLAGVNERDVRALIDRGIAADNSFPPGTGYLVRTNDVPRSVRYFDFLFANSQWRNNRSLNIIYVNNANGRARNTLRNKTDVMFYFTGLKKVPAIKTNTYRPGAVADHLTSASGNLTGISDQMSALRWLEAGLTASYGTVIEPCNYLPKFPQVSVLISHYYRGNTLLEAYWKSVHWPGEGVFVGEPLAAPWGRSFIRFENGALTIRSTLLKPRQQYVIVAADDPDGPFEVVLDNIKIEQYQMTTLTVPKADRAVYKLLLQ